MKKYQPSNGTEGEAFFRDWCCKCQRDKSMREGAAAREIEKNQDRIAAGHRLALELECLLMDTKDLPTVSRWWETGMLALTEWQALFTYNGPRLGD